MRSLRCGPLLLVSVCLLLLISACQPIALPTPSAPVPAEAGQSGPLPTRVLIVGGGWTTSGPGSLDAFLRGIAAAAQPELDVETATAYLWGSLEEQWEEGSALAAIRDGDWDVVVLEQDLAGGASNVGYYDQTVATYQEYVRRFHEEIAAAGTQTVLFASPEPQVTLKKGVDDFYQASADVAAELGIEVAPVGHAMINAGLEDPTLNFYGGENVMATTPAVYLSAAVLYATLYGRSPEGVTWLPTDDLGDDKRLDDLRRELTIAPEVRDLLFRVAWETVQGSD